jgi:hypothetical protein
MKKILILCLTVILVASFTACGKNEVLATIDGNKIYMSDIERDIKFITAIGEVDVNDQKAYDAMVLDVLNTYMIDYMCKEELERRGLKYSTEAYGSAYASLIDVYGSEKKLISVIESFGLDRSYVEELCRKQARKSTLCEELVKDIDIPDEDVLQYYIENSEEFVVDYVRSFYFLTFKDKSAAEAALEEIKTIGFMEYYNKQETEKTADYFDKLEHFESDYFPQSASAILFNIKVGSYHSEALSTFSNSGYSIFYCYEEIDDYKYTYDEMKVAIKEALIEDEESKVLEQFFEDINKDYEVEILYKSK